MYRRCNAGAGARVIVHSINPAAQSIRLSINPRVESNHNQSKPLTGQNINHFGNFIPELCVFKMFETKKHFTTILSLVLKRRNLNMAQVILFDSPIHPWPEGIGFLSPLSPSANPVGPAYWRTPAILRPSTHLPESEAKYKNDKCVRPNGKKKGESVLHPLLDQQIFLLHFIPCCSINITLILLKPISSHKRICTTKTIPQKIRRQKRAAGELRTKVSTNPTSSTPPPPPTPRTNNAY